MSEEERKAMSAKPEYGALLTEALLDMLANAGRGPDPELIRTLLERGSEATPRLLEMLAATPDESWDRDDPRWYVAPHAAQLFCALREPAALPLFERIIRDPDQYEMREWFDPELACCYGPLAVPMLTELAQDPGADEMARISAVGDLSVVAVHYPEQKSNVVDLFRSMLPVLDSEGKPVLAPEERNEPPELWTWVVLGLMELRDSESQPQVLALFDAGLIEEFVFGGRDDYLAAFKPGSDPPLSANYACDIYATYERLHQETIEQEEREALAPTDRDRLGLRSSLPGAASYEAARSHVQASTQQEVGRPAGAPVKVGRNDPCPCGSGKKYKKCCGRRQ